MSEMPSLPSSKPTLTISKPIMAYVFSLWVATVLATVVLVTCTLVSAPWTFVSFAGGVSMGVVVCLLLASWLLSPQGTVFLKGGSGATQTTDTPRSAFRLPPVAVVERLDSISGVPMSDIRSSFQLDRTKE
jgi:hypothetical protein